MVVGRHSLVIEIDDGRVNESWLDSRRPTSRGRELVPPCILRKPRKSKTIPLTIREISAKNGLLAEKSCWIPLTLIIKLSTISRIAGRLLAHHYISLFLEFPISFQGA